VGAYLAIEPVVRRRWPSTLIAWTRLLSGRPMDPLVGRNVLVGATLGVLGSAAYRVAHLLPLGDDVAARATLGFSVDPPWLPVGMIATAVSVQTTMALLFVLVMVGIRKLARREWATVLLMAVVLVLFDESRVYGTGSDAGLGTIGRIAAAFAASLVVCVTLALLYLRVGVLAAVAFIVAENVMRQMPALIDWSSWHAWRTFVPVSAIGLLCVWGAAAAVFGRAAADAGADVSRSRALGG
jgi:hypothetical protein